MRFPSSSAGVRIFQLMLLLVSLLSSQSLPGGCPPACGQSGKRQAADDKTAGWDTSFKSWPAKSAKTKAAVLSIHGFGLHKGAFDGFAGALSSEGIATYAIDVRGFGSWAASPGREADLDFYQTLMDVRTALYWIRRMHPDVPIFLLGESMGGAVALQAAALFPEYIKGLIASVPGDDYYGGGKTKVEVALRMVRPNSRIDLKEHVINRATRKDELRNSWQNDPEARLSLTPRQMAQFGAFMKKSHDLARTIDKTPVLMFQGAQDRLSKPDGTMRLFNELSTPDKDLIVLGNSEHLIFEREQFDEHVIDVLASWINKHAQASSTEAD